MVYFQIAASYFAFLETLFNGHLSFVLNLDKNALMLIVGSLELGIKDLSEKISSQVCKNLHIFWFENIDTTFNS
jgi:exportin-7